MMWWLPLNINDPEIMLEYIEDMLIRNYPVIMSVNTLNKDADRLRYYLLVYNLEGATALADTGYIFMYESWARGHYFVITGIIYTRDEVYLRVSNAGLEEYVIYSEYVEYVATHGVIGHSNINPGNAIIYYLEAET